MMKRLKLRRVVAVLAIAVCFAAGWLWFSLLSPWGYEPPPHMPIAAAEVPQRVFVYGTLRNRLIRWSVVGRDVPTEPSVLPGYHRHGLDVRERTNASVEGEVLVVDAGELRRLDRYERLGVRYERVEKLLQDESRAWVYRRINGS